MYDLNHLNIGEKLRYYRKNHGYTLEELGKEINKGKATVSKYEKNEIIPDIITIIEICNALKIRLDQLVPYIDKNIKSSSNLYNPFNTNTLYLYYYTNEKTITSVLELYSDVTTNTVKAKLYNGIKDINKYTNECSYYYEGIFEADKSIAFLNLKNTESKETFLENLLITINIPWTKNIEMCDFIISGLTPSRLPVMKKGILSTKVLNDLSDFDSDLNISKKESQEFYKKNAWILKGKDYDHFFYDINKSKLKEA